MRPENLRVNSMFDMEINRYKYVKLIAVCDFAVHIDDDKLFKAPAAISSIQSHLTLNKMQNRCSFYGNILTLANDQIRSRCKYLLSPDSCTRILGGKIRHINTLTHGNI